MAAEQEARLVPSIGRGRQPASNGTERSSRFRLQGEPDGSAAGSVAICRTKPRPGGGIVESSGRADDQSGRMFGARLFAREPRQAGY